MIPRLWFTVRVRAFINIVLLVEVVVEVVSVVIQIRPDESVNI